MPISFASFAIDSDHAESVSLIRFLLQPASKASFLLLSSFALLFQLRPRRRYLLPRRLHFALLLNLGLPFIVKASIRLWAKNRPFIIPTHCFAVRGF